MWLVTLFHLLISLGSSRVLFMLTLYPAFKTWPQPLLATRRFPLLALRLSPSAPPPCSFTPDTASFDGKGGWFRITGRIFPDSRCSARIPDPVPQLSESAGSSVFGYPCKHRRAPAKNLHLPANGSTGHWGWGWNGKILLTPLGYFGQVKWATRKPWFCTLARA